LQGSDDNSDSELGNFNSKTKSSKALSAKAEMKSKS
jgi:hypothetical protein